MFETFDSSIANDLNTLLQTHREDPSGQRLERAIAALGEAAERARQHWITSADASERSQAQALHEGLRAAAEVVAQVRRTNV
ncbi:hypothetical protein FZ025_16025 [Xanthomonas hyacinthi]|uniref:Serine kinase n=1 Tax=Xanthomonas hyacinthi TaxID=56455 RepID=A0A2S7ERB6_9XANT|nr:HrpD6 family protein [Xanthomonas hyacinthi]KLD76406.1 type III secretory pathway component [Xanthomonas hyacinthi DSM 19077]PPU95654.1 hypothetical protein XhyaCFBP1156_17890 [Xanthomonas hyacinthi]QGY78064.1 hypothetical protein FZ025_16025 [Xanthomonas hyacinthi]